MKVLILGASGMLGYSLFSNLSEFSKLDVYGTVRNFDEVKSYFNKYEHKLIKDIDVVNRDKLKAAFAKVSPDMVLNCVGLIKQQDAAKQHLTAIQINSLLPHQLASLCDEYQAKLIHFSTDCVFDGKVGLYREVDLPNSDDLYGRSKCLGEVVYGNNLTLRTSIIGHELKSSVSLVDWFLSQSGSVNGFSKAVFSGLPTCYIAKLLVENIFPQQSLTGLYHLSAAPIDKFSLLSMIASVYRKDIEIRSTEDFSIDRSLDSSRLNQAIGFTPPSWRELIAYMHNDYQKRYQQA